MSKLLRNFKLFTIGIAWVLGISSILFGIVMGGALFMIAGLFCCWCGQSIHKSIKQEEKTDDDDDERPNFPICPV